MNEDAKKRLVQLVAEALQPDNQEDDPVSVCDLDISFSDPEKNTDTNQIAQEDLKRISTGDEELSTDEEEIADEKDKAFGVIEVEISIPGEEEERADQIIEDVKARWESFAQAASEDQGETYILSAQVK